MPEIACPWDMCIHNARSHSDVKAKCTKDKVKLNICGKSGEFLKCTDFKSVFSERRTVNA